MDDEEIHLRGDAQKTLRLALNIKEKKQSIIHSTSPFKAILKRLLNCPSIKLPLDL